MAIILSGAQVAAKLNESTKQKVATINHSIKLASVFDSSNAGSQLYVNMKHEKAQEIGIQTQSYQVDSSMTTQQVLDLVEKLNGDPSISGILIQAPLPKAVDEKQVFDAVLPSKDPDGLTTINQGRLFMNSGKFVPPATPAGVMKLLDGYDLDVEGKNVVVVGRSVLFGKPMAALLLNANATVTVTHRYTLADVLDRQLINADFVIVGVGIPNFIKAHQIKEGAVVIDVGANKLDGKVVGDVDFKSVEPKAGYITPVPGGVGPMTIATLLSQLVDLAK
jgi:methylenetetrahydrofolate dehydrogenase (NADP+)/methenyltetrahydrofolate cyclohydrolase